MSVHHTQSVILTGDRITGPLHLGHYTGSLQQRVSVISLSSNVSLDVGGNESLV